MHAAYRRWGDETPRRLGGGDWSLAAWHLRERRLFVARDPYGHTALFLHADERAIVFAPTQRALLAIGLVDGRIDECYVAEYLVSLDGYHGPRAPIAPLRRLPPAHLMRATPQSTDVTCYWRMEGQPVVRRSEYVETFRELFDDAVRVRLRADGPIATMLSGGLDSGSVTITAAAQLRAEGRRLRALTAVPSTDADAFAPSRVTNELALARATADAVPNIDLETVPGQRLSPVGAIRLGLELLGGPIHAAANLYWLIELYGAAKASGHVALLSGAMGNASVSWSGSPRSQPLLDQLRQLGTYPWMRSRIWETLPLAVRRRIARARIPADWYRGSAIHPELVRRTDLTERVLQERVSLLVTGLEQRFAVLKPGRLNGGANQALLGAAHGLEIRDPTADVRVIEFVLSVPDSVFTDSATGTDRWLIREAMRGRLPDLVRLNTRRGQQAADLVPRLRASAAEVEATLDELERGPSAEFVDVAHMRTAWAVISDENTPRAFRLAVSVLTRGIMGGLHVNSLGADGRIR